MKVSKSLQNSVYVGALTMFWGRLFHSLITEGKKENLKLFYINDHSSAMEQAIDFK